MNDQSSLDIAAQAGRSIASSARQAHEQINRLDELKARQAALPLEQQKQQERHHQEVTRLQQELIEVQQQQLAEARKDKWKVTLLVSLLCSLISVLLTRLFG